MLPIAEMAKAFNVSKSGYYEWRRRKTCASTLVRSRVGFAIRQIYKENQGRCGAPMIHAELVAQGFSISARTVGRYMQAMDLRSIYRKKFKPTTNSDHSHPISPNVLNRNFKAEAPNRAWVSDITAIYCLGRWIYLCAIIDLYDRKVVGWHVSHRMKADLVLTAYLRAVRAERPGSGLIFHSDRGSQYTSKAFRKTLELNRHTQSMSRKGNCWDNAVAESWFKTLKVELVYQVAFHNIDQAQHLLFEYINIYYNRKRRHSYLGYESPENFRLKQAAA